MVEELQTVDYTTRRPNARAGIVKCPVCGRSGRRMAIPMTRGKNAGRVRVEVRHVEKLVDLGACRSIRDSEACYFWEDDPTTDTHRQALKGTE